MYRVLDWISKNYGDERQKVTKKVEHKYFEENGFLGFLLLLLASLNIDHHRVCSLLHLSLIIVITIIINNNNNKT